MRESILLIDWLIGVPYIIPIIMLRFLIIGTFPITRQLREDDWRRSSDFTRWRHVRSREGPAHRLMARRPRGTWRIQARKRARERERERERRPRLEETCQRLGSWLQTSENPLHSRSHLDYRELTGYRQRYRSTNARNCGRGSRCALARAARVLRCCKSYKAVFLVGSSSQPPKVVHSTMMAATQLYGIPVSREIYRWRYTCRPRLRRLIVSCRTKRRGCFTLFCPRWNM